jgi:hypothetical protein
MPDGDTKRHSSGRWRTKVAVDLKERLSDSIWLYRWRVTERGEVGEGQCGLEPQAEQESRTE